MITLKKLSTLKGRTQLRKCGSVFHALSTGQAFPSEYVHDIFSFLLSHPLVSYGDKEFLERKFKEYLKGDALSAEDIYYRCLRILGEEPSDWDSLDTDGSLDKSKRIVFPHRLFLDRVRSPYNLGSIFRSAESFGVEHIYIREGCGDINSPRCIKTARGAIESVPHSIVSDLSMLEGDVFALEVGGESIEEFQFPQSGICVIGSEESGVSPDALSKCSSRVSIPMFGAKGSLNVSVSSGILMCKWSLSV